MASRGKGARAKGQAFERFLAHTLTEATKREWKRGLAQTRGGGAETADVVCEDLPQFHIEAKNQKRCNIKAALAQAETDIGDKPNTVPIVITKDTGCDTLVTMKLADWLTMWTKYLDEVYPPRT
jgi:hypothetical protein